MKSGPWLVTVIAVAVAAIAWLTRPADQSAALARWRAVADSLAAVTARVDTVTVERTRTFTRWRDSTVTLRDSLTVTDTVEVVRFIAVQDSTIIACQAVVSSCAEGQRVRDQRIAALDSLNVATARQLRAERGKRVRDALAGAGVGVLAGLLWRR